MFLVFVLYHLMPSGNSKGSKIRHGIFWGLIFGAGILLGFNFYPHTPYSQMADTREKTGA